MIYAHLDIEYNIYYLGTGLNIYVYYSFNRNWV
jgi:hypothetical protein